MFNGIDFFPSIILKEQDAKLHVTDTNSLSQVMGGLSRRGDAPDKPGSSHEGNVDAGYPHLVEGE